MQKSAVSFSTARRIHIAIAVRDLDSSVKFYSTLFDQEPTKLREDYAKFEVAEPPVNFTLNTFSGEVTTPPAPQHFGIQVKDTDVLAELRSRLSAAGLQSITEDATTCCYAVADKVWVADPNGHKWELFVVLDADAEVHSIPGALGTGVPDLEGETPCCEPACCT